MRVSQLSGRSRHLLFRFASLEYRLTRFLYSALPPSAFAPKNGLGVMKQKNKTILQSLSMKLHSMLRKELPPIEAKLPDLDDEENLTLVHVMRDPILWRVFWQYVASQHAEEHVAFIDDLDTTKKTSNTKITAGRNALVLRRVVDRMKEWLEQGEAKMLVDEYMRHDSPMQVNLHHRLRKKVVDNFQVLLQKELPIPTKIFDASEKHVKQMLEQNFLRGVGFRKYVLKKPKVGPDKKKKVVVVIGGGFTGTTVARMLDYNPAFYVILIDMKEYFEFTPGVLKAMVFSAAGPSIRVPHTNFIKNGRVVVGEVRIVREHNVVVGYETIPFDYLVIATGSHYPSRIKTERATSEKQRQAYLKIEEARIRKAKKILIIGGGLVGVELATEIKDRVPSSKVTIAHRHLHFLQRIPGGHPHVAKRMKELGIETLMGTVVEGVDEKGRYLMTEAYIDFQTVSKALGGISKEHRTHLTKTTQGFLGTEAVTLMIRKGWCIDVTAAVKLGNCLIHSNLIKPYKRDEEKFKNDKTMYIIVGSGAAVESYTGTRIEETATATSGGSGVGGHAISVAALHSRGDGPVVEENKDPFAQTVFEADLAYWCGGPTPLTRMLSLHFKDALDENGSVKVDKFLRLEKHPHVFAGGDCCNTNEEKMAAIASAHGSTIAMNIMNGFGGKPLMPNKPAEGVPPICCALGVAKGLAFASKKMVPFAPGYPVYGNGSILKNRIEAIICEGLRQGINFYPQVMALFHPDVMNCYFGDAKQTFLSEDLAAEGFRQAEMSNRIIDLERELKDVNNVKDTEGFRKDNVALKSDLKTRDATIATLRREVATQKERAEQIQRMLTAANENAAAANEAAERAMEQAAAAEEKAAQQAKTTVAPTSTAQHESKAKTHDEVTTTAGATGLDQSSTRFTVDFKSGPLGMGLMGNWVVSVQSGSQAESLGVKPRMQIVNIDGDAIATPTRASQPAAPIYSRIKEAQSRNAGLRITFSKNSAAVLPPAVEARMAELDASATRGSGGHVPGIEAKKTSTVHSREEAMEVLTSPLRITKYHSNKGTSAARKIWVESEKAGNLVLVYKGGVGSPRRYIQVGNIRGINRGKQTEVFRRESSARAQPKRCLSVLTRSGKSLHFEAESESAARRWADALEVVTHRIG